ncbi:ATP-binding protein [Streptomyces sp. GC420]|uniref:sensor histidine kinase n=1 Tax=Streptomyces sp. GC420 TaxID=2697568 RepID=UPI0037D9F0C7
MTAAVGVPVTLAAPDAAGAWVGATVAAAGACVVAAATAVTLLQRRLGSRVEQALAESRSCQTELARYRSETAHLANVTLPHLAESARNGGSAGAAAGGAVQPTEPHLVALLRTVVEELDAAQRQVGAAHAQYEQAVRERARSTEDMARAASETLPTAVTRLREGASLDTVRGELRLHSFTDAQLRELLDVTVRELAFSERRSAAGQAASAKALGRVQAKAVSMLADLREMQDRHGQDVFGDLLKLDHSTSQLGLLTDRLALLMGGRSSRAWNKPIAMESILRGAVGRIAAYRRVSLNCSSSAAVAGFAAEGVMHLLAELMDNATNFSAPIDQVHVYVEERSAGIVVTIEDSGLKMADAAMRRAEEAVSGRMTDLASLQGTRLGLAVVGRLAAKYRISVSFRPSSRGGTGVVVLLPSQLLAQQRVSLPESSPYSVRAAQQSRPAPEPAAPPVTEPAVRTLTEPATVSYVRTDPDPAPGTRTRPEERTAPAAPASGPPADAVPGRHVEPAAVTTNGLPVRPPGRTMAAADRARPAVPRPAADRTPSKNAGARFGAFHRARRAAATGEPATPQPPRTPGPAASPEPSGHGDRPEPS